MVKTILRGLAGAAIVMCAMPMATAAQESGSQVATTANSGWWEESPWRDPERGFNWYPDPLPVKPPEAKPPETKDVPKSIYKMTNLEDINKELKRLRESAILNPTEKNVHEYLRAQSWIMDKSAVFADTARRVVWANPDVDYNRRSPAISLARQNQDQRDAKQRKDGVADLARENGLLFFARSDCPYCHDQAPILKLFERTFGMQVMAISMDGGVIPQFPDARTDNGISLKVTHGAGIEQVPAIFLVNRKTMEAVPLGTGVLAAQDIAERIRVLTKTTPGQEF